MLMDRATKILEGIKSSMSYCTLERGKKAKDIAVLLTDTIQPFAQQLNELNEVYIAIHVFFLIFQKVMQQLLSNIRVARMSV